MKIKSNKLLLVISLIVLIAILASAFYGRDLRFAPAASSGGLSCPGTQTGITSGGATAYRIEWVRKFAPYVANNPQSTAETQKACEQHVIANTDWTNADAEVLSECKKVPSFACSGECFAQATPPNCVITHTAVAWLTIYADSNTGMQYWGCHGYGKSFAQGTYTKMCILQGTAK